MMVAGPGEKKGPRNPAIERASWTGLGATRSGVDVTRGFSDGKVACGHYGVHEL